MTDDEQWKIPEKFRASADISDEAAYAMLQKCNAEQKLLGAKINAPFSRASANSVARSKAFITIETLYKIERNNEQTEQLAESYAAIGRYDLASNISANPIYGKYWEAVFRDDNDWCEHPRQHRYIKEYIFSIQTGRETPMIACNICGFWNAGYEADSLNFASRTATKHQGMTAGMTIEEAKAYHQQNVK